MERRRISTSLLSALHATGSGIWGLETAAASDRPLEPLRSADWPLWDRSSVRQPRCADPCDPDEAAIYLLALAVETKDPTLQGHCARLARYAVAMGKALDLDAATLEVLRRGGVLHDIGKIRIPDAILFKPGPLTAEEWLVVREHPVIGEQICRPLAGLKDVLPIIRHHHERPDGGGYPDGLAGPAIPLNARILQVADVFDALTSPRPYRRPLPLAVALRSLCDKAARGLLDAELVEVFARQWATPALN